MNNVTNFSKYDDDLINDITEGKVINEKDGATFTWGGLPAGHNISIIIPNWYIFCFFELFNDDFKSDENHIDVTSKSFGQFVTTYIGDREKCFFVLIDAAKFDTVITTHFKNIDYHYRRIEFIEYDPIKRMESYFKGDAIPLLFQKRPKYQEKLSEKRLSIFFPNKEGEKDFIRLELKEMIATILFKGFIDRDMVLRQNMLQE